MNRPSSLLLPLLCLFLLLLAFAACSEEAGKQSRLDPSQTTDAADTTLRSNESEPNIAFTPTSSFAADLLQLMPKDQNYMVSPLGLQTALAMLANGASGETKTQLLQALKIDDLASFNQKTRALIDTYDATNAFSIHLANALWLNESVVPTASFAPAFEQTMADFFSASPYTVTREDAVSRINAWADEKTNGRIRTILAEEQNTFALALTNAVYFKAGWANRFPAHLTQDDTFTDRNGVSRSLPFMETTRSMRYLSKEGLTMVRLPYEDRHYAMYLLLSDDAALPADLDSFIDEMASERVRLRLPRFSIDFSITVNDLLATMGATRLFDENTAELDGLLTGLSDPLVVDTILHKTGIDVDEEGTEAAAVTAILVEATSAVISPADPIEFTADRPFFFFIRDDQNKEILFAGEYAFAE